MVNWELGITKQAQMDAIKLVFLGLKNKAKLLLHIIQKDPYQNPPPDEKLVGDLSGAYSRRINIQHRLYIKSMKKNIPSKLSDFAPNAAYLRRTSLYFRHSGMFLAGIQPEKL